MLNSRNHPGLLLHSPAPCGHRCIQRRSRPRDWKQPDSSERWVQNGETNSVGNYHMSWLIIVSTSSTAQGGGGSFKNRKPIEELGCCESRMAERTHWWTDRSLRSVFFLSLSVSFSHYLPTYPPIYLSIHLSLSLSIYLSICLSIYLSTYLSIRLSIYLSTYLSI